MNNYTWTKFKSTPWDRILNFALTQVGVTTKYRYKVLKFIKIMKSPLKYYHRKKNILKLLAKNPPTLIIPPKEGYLILNSNDLPGLSNVVAIAQKITKDKQTGIDAFYLKTGLFKAKPFAMDKNGNLTKYYNLEETKEIIDFACSKEMVSIAANYLGEMPILGNIFLLHTDKNMQTQDAQRYHLDKRYHNRIQFFIILEDVDERNGPFTFLPYSVSLQVMNKLKYYNGRLTDEQVYEHTSPDQAIKVTGVPGTTLMINASKCFHYGSRSRDRQRVMLEIMYASPFNPIGVGSMQLKKLINPTELHRINDPFKIIQ